jgi:hypothetical protein
VYNRDTGSIIPVQTEGEAVVAYFNIIEISERELEYCVKPKTNFPSFQFLAVVAAPCKSVGGHQLLAGT